ncbi:hypothetical protein K2173_009487 [Erythroxylum novogranatense]|uniref:PGG domain-containing protein n=1 Tax=Erythroxylum novogranatense TaxID=1862640 RepID=A0AAV8U437_9ROSI|nr:hypothetical protein K2173_009487 [Erythroxylum novogranatense]
MELEEEGSTIAKNDALPGPVDQVPKSSSLSPKLGSSGGELRPSVYSKPKSRFQEINVSFSNQNSPTHEEIIDACATETNEPDKNSNNEDTSHEPEKKPGPVKINKDSVRWLHLFKAVIRSDWKFVESIFDKEPEAMTARVTLYGSNALHVAIRRGLSKQFIQKLVDKMPPESLEMRGTSDQGNPLHCAGIVGHTDAAKILMMKNPGLLEVQDSYNFTPLHRAAQFAHKETVWFLLSEARFEDYGQLSGSSGAMLLSFLIVADFYDIALSLLKKNPDLASERDYKNLTALDRLARKPHAFASGSQLGYLGSLLYKSISVKSCAFLFRKGDVEEPRQIGFLKNLYKKKLMHSHSLELAKALCAEIIELGQSTDESLYKSALFMAAKEGIHELVNEILKAFPDALWFRDDDSRDIFLLAVLHRQEKVFNLVYQIRSLKYAVFCRVDNFQNSALHLAGKLEPSNRIAGAALQMQREMQWFKVIENFVQPDFKILPNKDMKTPIQVFIEEHKKLVVKGEEWMKNTASSCTVVAALVVTVVFAAAFTVPGGNNNNGTPIFLNDLSFLVFTVANALALFTSTTSMLMFLGMLTSRYAREDFLMALPMRLSIGLITLFLSIAFMLAAFSAALNIILEHKLRWVAAPITLLACIPVALFALLQFPLLVELVSSTFGPSVFRQQSKEIIC